MIAALPLLLLIPAQTLTAEDIMARVAANQERADDARKAYVYDMNVFVRLHRANGKLAREENRDYIVAPGAKGSQRKLIKLEGKILEGKQEIPYTEPRYQVKKVDLDAALTDSFAQEVMWRRQDHGPMVSWFPLTSSRQSNYTFTLNGEERYHDYDVYKITWKPKEPNQECWSGEALIERSEFQPVLITSAFVCKVPRAVTLMAGITVSHIGAKITYQRFDKDIWFPVVCGGEMKLRLFFGYARTIAFSAKNAGFRKTDVQSSITFEGEEESEEPAAVTTP